MVKIKAVCGSIGRCIARPVRLSGGGLRWIGVVSQDKPGACGEPSSPRRPGERMTIDVSPRSPRPWPRGSRPWRWNRPCSVTASRSRTTAARGRDRAGGARRRRRAGHHGGDRWPDQGRPYLGRARAAAPGGRRRQMLDPRPAPGCWHAAASARPPSRRRSSSPRESGSGSWRPAAWAASIRAARARWTSRRISRSWPERRHRWSAAASSRSSIRRRTLERLETLGVPVVGYRLRRAARFLYRRDAASPCRGSTTWRICAACTRSTGRSACAGLVVGAAAAARRRHGKMRVDRLVERRVRRRAPRRVRGPATPFMLQHMAEHSQGATVRVNCALAVANARLAAELAALAAASRSQEVERP